MKELSNIICGILIVTLIVVILFLGTGLVLMMTVEPSLEKIPVLTEQIEIVSIKDNITTEGSFFLGSGHIRGELYYFYYRKYKGGYKAGKLKANNVIIYEGDNNPCIKKYKAQFKEKSSKWWFKMLEPMKKYEIEIYVPKNSIIKNYKLDLE